MVYKLRSIVATFSILMVVASAHPYNEWNHARHRWNDLFASRVQEIGARIRSQPQADVKMSSCATVTEMKDGKPYRVRVCTADPEGICRCTQYVCIPLWSNSVEPIIGTVLLRFRGEPIKKWEGLIIISCAARSSWHQGGNLHSVSSCMYVVFCRFSQ